MTHPIRARLEHARDLLKGYEHPDSADGVSAIDAVLAPRGWAMLREGAAGSGAVSPLSLTMTKQLKDALKSAAAEFGESLGLIVEEGFRAVLETDWLPPKTLKELGRNQQEKARNLKDRTVLQLNVNEALKTRVQKASAELSERAGYRVTASSIAIAWMADELGVDVPSAEDRTQLKMRVRRTLRDHVVAVAAARGTTVDEVLVEGIRDLLAGRWEPQLSGWNLVHERPREGGKWASDPSAPVDKVKLSVRMDQDLLDGLRARAAEMNEQAPVPVYPGTIAIAILKDRLGEPTAAE